MSALETIGSISNIACGLINTGFGVSLMISQKDYTDALKSNVNAQTRLYNFALDTKQVEQDKLKQQQEIEKELLYASQRYINGVADDEDIKLLATYYPESFTNVYVDKDTKQAVITVSKQPDDTELEQRAVVTLQKSNDINYTLIGIGALALIFLVRRKK